MSEFEDERGRAETSNPADPDATVVDPGRAARQSAGESHEQPTQRREPVPSPPQQPGYVPGGRRRERYEGEPVVGAAEGMGPSLGYGARRGLHVAGIVIVAIAAAIIVFNIGACVGGSGRSQAGVAQNAVTAPAASSPARSEEAETESPSAKTGESAGDVAGSVVGDLVDGAADKLSQVDPNDVANKAAEAADAIKGGAKDAAGMAADALSQFAASN